MSLGRRDTRGATKSRRIGAALDEAAEAAAEGEPSRAEPLLSSDETDAGIALLMLDGSELRTLVALLLSISGMAGADDELRGLMDTARCAPPLTV